MKKLLSLVFVLLLVCPLAMAESSFDLSTLSYDALVQLAQDALEEAYTREEWKSVPVPPGFYEIGVDIPEGWWVLTPGKTEYGYISIEYGNVTNEAHSRIVLPAEYIGLVYVKSETYPTFLRLNLTQGYYLLIKYGQCYFSSPTPSLLGF